MPERCNSYISFVFVLFFCFSKDQYFLKLVSHHILKKFIRRNKQT